MTSIFDVLVADLERHLTTHSVRPVAEKVRAVLNTRGVDCPWSFAKSFGFADPYGAFRSEYLARFVWAAGERVNGLEPRS